MNSIVTRRRVILSGTPLQNNLEGYHCMGPFVQPNVMGTQREFRNRFVTPICKGLAADSNEIDVKVMKKRVLILFKLVEDMVFLSYVFSFSIAI